MHPDESTCTQVSTMIWVYLKQNTAKIYRQKVSKAVMIAGMDNLVRELSRVEIPVNSLSAQSSTSESEFPLCEHAERSEPKVATAISKTVS